MDDCSGEMVSVYKYELDLLRKIAESSSDFVLSTSKSEFASLNGGEDVLFNIMVTNLCCYAEWVSGFDHP